MIIYKHNIFVYQLSKQIFIAMKTFYVTIVLTILFIQWKHSDSKPFMSNQCGYSRCDVGKPGMLNVHLVPHGHCDTGWDKTVDQYYYGSKNTIMNVGIQYNIDAVVQGLMFDTTRRFTWIEVAYFWRWWSEQTKYVKNLVRGLVNEGRLQFANNAWEMNDEASISYMEIIDQHALGENFLVETFGPQCGKPYAAWQIDTFGHSREMASLLSQMGHDALYFGRLDYQDEARRKATKQMELMWKGSDDLGSSSNLFTGVLYNLYLPPDGFLYSSANTEPIMDDPKLFDYNVDSIVKSFVKSVTDWAYAYPTNHVFIPMGNDFDYELANRWFKNEDRLIKHVNALQAKGSKINVMYSTIPCYTYAVHSTNFTFTSKTDEFFPYASRDHTFWTGSFVSRPTLKGYVRDSNAFHQVAKQMAVFSGIYANAEIKYSIFELSRGLAINDNHGQLPGTQTQKVAADNALRLSNGTLEAFKVVKLAYAKLSSNSLTNPYYCLMLNISECFAIDENSSFTLSIYNPLSWSVTHWTRIPIMSNIISIEDVQGHTVNYDIFPITEITKNIPERKSNTPYEAVFPINLPPLGYTSLHISANNHHNPHHYFNMDNWISKPSPDETFIITNKYLELIYDGKTNLIQSIKNLQTGKTIDAEIDLRYYTAYVGNNDGGANQASGAYIFRPNEKYAWTFPTCNIRVIRGKGVQEVHQEFSTWATMVTRLYTDTPYIEIEWTVGPIPMQGKIGKEIIINYQTSMKNNRSCTTDSNGRQMIPHLYDYRATWNLSQTEPVAGNYNPINSAIYIEDKEQDQRLTVLVDRAQGGTSLREGQLEIMVHRRLGVDDSLGVNEALNELGVDGKGLIARGRHWLIFNASANGGSNRLTRPLMHQMQLRPTVTVVNHTSFDGVLQFSGLRRPLPSNIKILSLEAWSQGSGNKVILRLEHIYQNNEDPALSQPVQVDLGDSGPLFSNFNILSGIEMNLSGSISKDQMKRLKWNYKTRDTNDNNDKPIILGPGSFKFIMIPMEIKTFLIDISFQ